MSISRSDTPTSVIEAKEDSKDVSTPRITEYPSFFDSKVIPKTPPSTPRVQESKTCIIF